MLTEKDETVDGLRLHIYQAGDSGPPVILLHGGGTDSARLSWRLTVPDLVPAYRVYLPDWPGYGQSQPLDEPGTTDRLIEIILKLMEAWEIPSASLVGVSMGGAVALGTALAQPHRVTKLVLVDSYGLQAKAPFHTLSYLMVKTPGVIRWSWDLFRRSRGLTRMALESIFYDQRAVDDELVEEVFEALQAPGIGDAFYSWQQGEVGRAGLQTYYTDRFEELDLPVLIIHGEKDRLVPVECAYQAAKRIRGGQLKVLPECGHWPQREQPQAFNRALVEFLGA